MTRHVDARAEEADSFPTQPSAVGRESGESVRTDHSMARHLGVVARAHDIPDCARGERAAGDDAHETVGSDAAGRNPLHDATHGARPGIHARIMPNVAGQTLT